MIKLYNIMIDTVTEKYELYHIKVSKFDMAEADHANWELSFNT